MSTTVREVFRERVQRVLNELLLLDQRYLAEAIKAPGDFGVLITALKTDAALGRIAPNDPLVRSRLRGIEQKRALVEAEGGTLSSQEAADLLGISRQAVDKRRQAGKLLALDTGKKGYRYPAWQFELSGLEPLLGALRGKDPWEQASFFLNPSAALGDRTPLDALRSGESKLPEVVDAALHYGEHGA
jgi:biotin operon repressor